MHCPKLSELPPSPQGKVGWPWTVETPPVLSNRQDDRRWPRISIVTPSYNQGQFIEETIRSVLLQGYLDLEYIVIDGGSTDETIRIIKKYEPWLSFWVSERDKGQSHAINKGFERASGEVLGWLNSDDLLTPDALGHVGDRFAKEADCMVLAGSSEIRTCDGAQLMWAVSTIPASLVDLYQYAQGKYLAQPSVFFRRTALELAGPVREDLHYAMDLDLWMRLVSRFKIDTTNSQLSWMRHHDGAKTYSGNLALLQEVEDVLKPYEGLVPAGVCLSARRALRLRRSEAWSREGLRAHFAGNRKRAWQAAFFALAEAHSTFAKRVWLGLLVRLVLPNALRSMVLRRP